MSPWDAASVVINATFVDPELLHYTPAGADPRDIPAIRCDTAAPSFNGGSGTIRSVEYEIQMSALPARPTKGDRFNHRGRTWRIENVEDRPEVRAWSITVADNGAAT